MIDNFFNLYLEIHILSINNLSWILLNIDLYMFFIYTKTYYQVNFDTSSIKNFFKFKIVR